MKRSGGKVGVGLGWVSSGVSFFVFKRGVFAKGSQGKQQQLVGTLLGVDSLLIIFNHRSFQKPIAVSPRFSVVFWKEGCLERMGKVPLEGWVWFRFVFEATHVSSLVYMYQRDCFFCVYLKGTT